MLVVKYAKYIQIYLDINLRYINEKNLISIDHYHCLYLCNSSRPPYVHCSIKL